MEILAKMVIVGGAIYYGCVAVEVVLGWLDSLMRWAWFEYQTARWLRRKRREAV